MTTWHRFTPTGDDDNECAHPSCGAVVADDALALFYLPCPVPACTDGGNDGPCVFVRGDRGPECAYCGRSGLRDAASEDGDDDEDFDYLDVTTPEE